MTGIVLFELMDTNQLNIREKYQILRKVELVASTQENFLNIT